MAENAILVAVKKSSENKIHFKDSIKELKLLAKTAKARVKEILTQERHSPSPSTYIGKGKVEELKTLAEKYEADLIIFNDQLSP
ncbi:MAG: GTPase HflX, partial [Actinobacteria bacterium]